jgi:hypothetical protein
MKILQTELSAKGDEFVKGDRVAVDADKGKTPTGDWWIGTVMDTIGSKIHIKHDDDGSVAEYPFARSQTPHFIKLPKATKKIKVYLTTKQVKTLVGVEPIKKPAAADNKTKTNGTAISEAFKKSVMIFDSKRYFKALDEPAYKLAAASFNSNSWLRHSFVTAALKKAHEHADAERAPDNLKHFLAEGFNLRNRNQLYAWQFVSSVAVVKAALASYATRAALGYGTGPAQSCFKNARMLVQSDPSYQLCVGFIDAAPKATLLIVHAFTIRDGKIFDPTNVNVNAVYYPMFVYPKGAAPIVTEIAAKAHNVAGSIHKAFVDVALPVLAAKIK